MNESNNVEPNLFDLLRCGGAVENTFSAGLAYLLASEPNAQRVFLDFLEAQTGVSIPQKDGWEVRTEVKRRSRDQTIYVDMVLSRTSPVPTELWFEHKIESSLGEGQLERYLEAVALHAEAELEEGGQKTVQLAFISRRRLDLRSAKRSRIQDASHSGVRWCTAEDEGRGFISWVDLLPEIREHCSAEWGRTNQMFVDWWARLPNMVAPESPSSWSDLIPKQQADGTFGRTRLDGLWSKEVERAKQLGWTKDGSPYVGNDHNYRREDLRLQVIAFDSHEMASKKSGINLADMRAELLEVSLVGDGLDAVPEARGMLEGSLGRRWTLKSTTKGPTTWIRVVVEVGEVSNDDFPTDIELAELLADSFSAAVDVLRQEVPPLAARLGYQGVSR